MLLGALDESKCGWRDQVRSLSIRAALRRCATRGWERVAEERSQVEPRGKKSESVGLYSSPLYVTLPDVLDDHV